MSSPTSESPISNTFSETDSQKLISLLNFVATNAEFNGLDVKKILEFTKLLNWAQTQLLPKIEANVFEVMSVKEVAPQQASNKKK